MTIKGLKSLGFDIQKGEGYEFTISKGKFKAVIKKITDTKFQFNDNEPTPHVDKLLEQIKQNK